MLLDVVKVNVADNYNLILEFENGEIRQFDMNPLLDLKPWIRIKPKALFDRAYIDNGTVAWPGNIDIAPETLYDCSVQLEGAKEHGECPIE